MMKQKIAILGKNGFLAKNFIQHLEMKNQEIEVKALSSKDLNLERDFTHPVLAENIDTLVIFSGLKRNRGENLDTFQLNSLISQNISRLVTNYSFKKVIYISSCAVYGEDVQHDKISVNQKLTPTSFYGIAKAECEYLLTKEISNKLLIIRPPTVFGTDSGNESYDPRGFYHKIAHGMLLTLWGDGSELREFLYVDDLCQLIEQNLFNTMTGTLNACSGNSYSFLDVISHCELVTGFKANVVSKERSKAKVDHSFEALSGFQFTNLEDGIRRIHEREKSS